MDQLTARPDNVPADRYVDFDFLDFPGVETDVHKAWTQLYDGPDIIWTPRNGGHWIAIRAAVIDAINRDWESFSSASVTIPPNPLPSLPLEADPPMHTSLRALVSPLFAPDTLKDVDVRARALTNEIIDGFIDKGRCEFIGDFARRLPIEIFLYLVDLPVADAPQLLDWAEKRVRSHDPDERAQVKVALIDYLGEVIAKRRANPGRDFISRILSGDVEGRPLTDFEAQNLLATLLFGGLDTVASMLGFAMRLLARSPAHRQQLLADRTLAAKAVSEILRAHGLTNTCRVVARDAEVAGIHFRTGDKIMLPSVLAGRDERKFPHGDEVDFNRANAGEHLTFGSGIHRCPGANLARTELKIVLEEWLPRIPDFQIDPNDEVVFGFGFVSGVNHLPLVWEPPKR